MNIYKNNTDYHTQSIHSNSTYPMKKSAIDTSTRLDHIHFRPINYRARIYNFFNKLCQPTFKKPLNSIITSPPTSPRMINKKIINNGITLEKNIKLLEDAIKQVTENNNEPPKYTTNQLNKIFNKTVEIITKNTFEKHHLGILSDRLSDIKVKLEKKSLDMKIIGEHAAEKAKLLIIKRYIKSSSASKNMISDEIQKYYENTLPYSIPTKDLSAGINKVERIGIETNWGFSKKIIKKQTLSDQQAQQVSLVGNLGRFFNKANIIGALRLKNKIALSENIEGLQIGNNALKKINVSSPKTQHTALASLTLQAIDLHKKNIGINADRELILFDTDQLLYENNYFFCASEDNINSPLGQNYLQTLDITIDNTVLKEHLESLYDLISSELPGVNLRLSPEQGRTVHNVLTQYLIDDEDLSIFSNNNNLFAVSNTPNVPSKSINISIIKNNFSKKIKSNAKLKKDITLTLKRKGIPKSAIDQFMINPSLLHPKNMTLRQMDALRERADNLIGFKCLRETLSNKTIRLHKKVQLIQDHIFSIPCDADTKIKILTQLEGNLIKKHRAIQQVSTLVSGHLTFNTLARSAYPTVSKLYDHFKNESNLAEALSWHNAHLYRSILEEERFKLHKIADSVTDLTRDW